MISFAKIDLRAPAGLITRVFVILPCGVVRYRSAPFYFNVQRSTFNVRSYTGPSPCPVVPVVGHTSSRNGRTSSAGRSLLSGLQYIFRVFLICQVRRGVSCVSLPCARNILPQFPSPADLPFFGLRHGFFTYGLLPRTIGVFAWCRLFLKMSYWGIQKMADIHIRISSLQWFPMSSIRQKQPEQSTCLFTDGFGLYRAGWWSHKDQCLRVENSDGTHGVVDHRPFKWWAELENLRGFGVRGET